MDKQAAVNECVDYLFTDGFGSKAVRLVMIDSEGRYGAGWSKLPAADVIAKVYDAGYKSACGEWVRIEGPETLPKQGQDVNFVVAGIPEGSTYAYLNGRVLGGKYHGDSEFSVPGASYPASHWMPIPPLTDNEGGENAER